MSTPCVFWPLTLRGLQPFNTLLLFDNSHTASELALMYTRCYRALARVLPETSCVLQAVENNREMWFHANVQLIERGLPRNMDVFRHLDSLVL